MNWTQFSKKAVEIEATSAAKSMDELAIDYREFLNKFAEVVATIPNDSWNRLYFNYLPEQGKLVAFAHKRGDILSKTQCMVVVYSPFVSEKYGEILDAEHESDEMMEFNLSKVANAMCIALGKYKNKSDVRAAYKKLREQTDHTCWEMFDSDFERLVPMNFL